MFEGKDPVAIEIKHLKTEEIFCVWKTLETLERVNELSKISSWTDFYVLKP